jgi:hypothetical protein
METRSFFSSLFDYSFSSYITPRIIRVLYVLATIIIALWTLVIVLLAFRASKGLGVVTLLIFGPLYFLIAMIWARVGLEVISAFFRIHEHVQQIDTRAGGSGGASEAPALPASPETWQGPAVTATAAEPSSEAAPAEGSSSGPARFCDNCGAERSPGKRFCPSCGTPFE